MPAKNPKCRIIITSDADIERNAIAAISPAVSITGPTLASDCTTARRFISRGAAPGARISPSSSS